MWLQAVHAVRLMPVLFDKPLFLLLKLKAPGLPAWPPLLLQVKMQIILTPSQQAVNENLIKPTQQTSWEYLQAVWQGKAPEIQLLGPPGETDALIKTSISRHRVGGWLDG